MTPSDLREVWPPYGASLAYFTTRFFLYSRRDKKGLLFSALYLAIPEGKARLKSPI